MFLVKKVKTYKSVTIVNTIKIYFQKGHLWDANALDLDLKMVCKFYIFQWLTNIFKLNEMSTNIHMPHYKRIIIKHNLVMFLILYFRHKFTEKNYKISKGLFSFVKGCGKLRLERYVTYLKFRRIRPVLSKLFERDFFQSNIAFLVMRIIFKTYFATQQNFLATY
jgi:hypothetical protein